MRTNRLYLLLIATTLFLFKEGATAGIIIGNYPPTNDGLFSTIAATSGRLSKAAGFSLPAVSNYILDSIKLRLDVNDPSSTVSFSLYGDIGGNPGGSVLASFTTRALVEGIGDYSLAPDHQIELQSLHTYWIAATGISPTVDGVTWLASNPGLDPTGIATNAGYRSDSSGSFPPTRLSTTKNTYQVNATVVPEPSTCIFGIALAGILIMRRQRS